MSRSDETRIARAIEDMALQELGFKVSHRGVMNLVCSTPRNPNEPREVFAARIFELHRAGFRPKGGGR